MSRFNSNVRVHVYLCALATAALAFAATADPAADTLPSKVRTAIKTDIAESTGVTCMLSVERTRYQARAAATPSCAGWITASAQAPRGPVLWRDRIRLDVTGTATGEQFAFTGASPFERADILNMLGDATARAGEFSTFLRTAMDAGQFQSPSPQNGLLSIAFTLPGQQARGTLYALPDSGDIRRLTLETRNAGGACRTQYAVDYAATRAGERQLILPLSSVMETIAADGTELHSETFYSSCRRPAAPAKPASLPGPQKPLPPNTRIRIRFEPPINGQTAATGDPVVGQIRNTIKDKQEGVLIHAGDRLHGRIARIEQFTGSDARWNVAIVWETIERGVGDHGIDQGIEQPVTLVPLSENDVTLRPPGGAWFTLRQPSVVLDQRFETDWEIR